MVITIVIATVIARRPKADAAIQQVVGLSGSPRPLHGLAMTIFSNAR
jgi:hypothetical protein